MVSSPPPMNFPPMKTLGTDLLKIATLVSSHGLISTSNEFPPNENPGNRSSSSNLLHVVLNLIHIWIVLNLHNFNALRLNIVTLQSIFCFHTKWTIFFRNYEDWFLLDFLIDGIYDRHLWEINSNLL